MADEKKEQTPVPAKKNSTKTIIVVVVALLIEVGTIAATMYMSGGPAELQAEGLTHDDQAELNRIVEVMIIKEKFHNQRSGHPMLFDTEIYINAQNRHIEQVNSIYEASKAGITVDIGTIIRQADPAFFNEKDYATLRRQIKSVLDKRFGKDKDGKPLVEQVLITKCFPYRADF